MSMFGGSWSREDILDEYYEDRPIGISFGSDDFISTLDNMIENADENGIERSDITVQAVKDKVNENDNDNDNPVPIMGHIRYLRRYTMSKVNAQVTGGQLKSIEASTVAEAKAALGLEGAYTATINGEPAKDSDSLSNYNHVSFAEAVKGGC